MKSASPYLVYFAVIAYLLINTGVVSDDFADIAQFRDKSFVEVLPPSGNAINTPVGHFSHRIWFRYFGLDNLFVVDLFKIAFTLLSFYLISKFFRLFLATDTAFLVSFVFIFFPSHDAMPYAYAPSGHVLSIALYLYAYYMAHRDKLILAFLLALAASFMVYGSTPIAVALFVLFVANREIKKGVVMIVPNAIYAMYFMYVSIIAALAPSRILEQVSATSLVKQFVFQVATFADATLGPSMWLKIYYSFYQLSALSWAVGAVLVVLLVKTFSDKNETHDKNLLVGLVVLALCSFAMFAVTGRYPQLAFNLGNRTTLWGSLLITYLIVLMPGPRYLKLCVLGIMAFAILGISDHWKAWNLHQQAVVRRIANSQALRDYREDREIFVSGNQYSRFGPISHIEFLSEDWVPQSVFRLVSHENIRARSINRRFSYVAGNLVDGKYNTRIQVSDYINVYDSESDRLLRVNVDDINPYLATLPEEKRHWSMLGDNGFLAFIKKGAVFLMPRLSVYL